MSDEHCVDCCCARSWRALGISEFTGRSIPEEIEQLRARIAELEAALTAAAQYNNTLEDECDKIFSAFREAATQVAQAGPPGLAAHWIKIWPWLTKENFEDHFVNTNKVTNDNH